MPYLTLMVGATAIVAAAFWTANDPFVGKWKLDVSRSTIVDQMSVEATGPNKYTFRFEGGPPEVIVADGTDQPGILGTTLSVRADDARTLKVIRKRAGRVIISADWKVSADGRTLRDAFRDTQSYNSNVTVDYVYKRMSGTSGFVGGWESTTKPLGLKLNLEIKPHGDEGLSFVRQGSVKNIRFDGQDHAVGGGAAADGVTASGRRLSERVMTFTDKNKGAITDRQSLTLSRDGKSLTIHVAKTGQATANVLVFARE